MPSLESDGEGRGASTHGMGADRGDCPPKPPGRTCGTGRRSALPQQQSHPHETVEDDREDAAQVYDRRSSLPLASKRSAKSSRSCVSASSCWSVCTTRSSSSTRPVTSTGGDPARDAVVILAIRIAAQARMATTGMRGARSRGRSFRQSRRKYCTVVTTRTVFSIWLSCWMPGAGSRGRMTNTP